MIPKIRPFPRNIDIYGFMDKKRFFQNVHKKCALLRNVDIYEDMDKNDFLKISFFRYVDSFKYMDKKRFLKMI